MTVRLLGSWGEITFAVMQRSDDDVQVKVAVRTAHASDQTIAQAGVWLHGAEVRRFVEDMANLDATRRGSAHLNGMSPDEFSFTLTAVGSRGHCKAKISLDLVGSTAPMKRPLRP